MYFTGRTYYEKNITKVIIASTVIATGLLTHSNDAKAFFSYEWKGLEIAKKLADEAKKDDERIDKLMKEADKNQKPYKGETVNDLYLIVKKLSQGDVKKAVVKMRNGGPKDFYTFDLTRPLEENRKNIPLVKNGEIDSIYWDQ
ncbi:TPA: formyl peptide receptor-like 1 inhibitory protein [Staphylococcus aureus]|uniref:FPRL1 inhibitory protein FLIPr n=1 Tax=Staphylococcus aureus TaxID=1280 RepID=UPI0004A34F14|nr:formyl peptide receptor-like 1 inhibitory protein [Staphylococcus aureus]MCS4889038.1 formyl peptide receptor-like 1 inhibitory protein [Staphylococcus aureus]HBC4334858.1 formyl peptide receptor-like 1 inhibitory protein [Staphylococcus aureus]HDA2224367.1 formyl peptide receptor-like 1 inhibitory protein [Staphylococcus aureus]HDB7925816.1 formyl peptide receptor-like 1 inhibitory protein [Staphylococcus aureus]HDC3665173.1 formyl peptide receptor-like 1 inhibitory protein [Staphylococcus